VPTDYKGLPRETYGREVFYDIPDPKLKQATQWLVGNSNRINRGRTALQYKDAILNASNIINSRQVLDLWSGVITLTFEVGHKAVGVVTQGEFGSDAVAVSIESGLVESGDLTVELDFPCPSIHSTKCKYEVFVGVYDFPLNHTTALVEDGKDRTSAHIQHVLQGTSYFVNLRWPKKTLLKLYRMEPFNSTAITVDRYSLIPISKTSSVTFTAHSFPDSRVPSVSAKIQDRSIRGWNHYWEDGGFVELTASTNLNATELQRRIIKSQYHVRVDSAPNGQPSQESGLMNNGRYGTSRLQTASVRSLLIIDREVPHGDGNPAPCSLGDMVKQRYFDGVFPKVYETLLPSLLARAKSMRWEGAQWPKVTELQTGVSAPGDINGVLLWQQPHHFYLAKSTRETLQRGNKVLTSTADYMASFSASTTLLASTI
jgi:hypothetical protein